MKGNTKYKALSSSTIGNDDTLFALWGCEANMMYDSILGDGRCKNISKSDSGAFKAAPSQVETCIVNGVPFYVVLDDNPRIIVELVKE